VRFQTEVTIERPRDDVFHRLADELAQTIPLICPLTISVTLDSDKPIGAGTTGKMTLQNLFISYVVDFEVTRYEQHKQFSLEARYRTRSAHSDYLFRDAGNGTAVTIVTDAPAIGPRWLQGWNHRILERHERRDAQRFKALLEGRGGDPTPGVVRRNRRRSVAIFVMVGATLALAWFLIRTLL